jgi:ATP-dependent Clp protease ATP-binding subunit ClpC
MSSSGWTKFIGTEHILLGLIHEGDGIAAHALERCGITLEATRNAVDETIGRAGSAPSGSPPFTPRAKRALELALREALQLNHNYIGTEHLLFGLIDEGEGVAAQVIQNLGVNLDVLRGDIFDLMSGSAQEESREGHEGISNVLRVSGSAERADPPRCQRCGAGLVAEARYRVINVLADAPQADENVVSVSVIYCRRCGTTIGTV